MSLKMRLCKGGFCKNGLRTTQVCGRDLLSAIRDRDSRGQCERALPLSAFGGLAAEKCKEFVWYCPETPPGEDGADPRRFS